jgi:peptidoglycan hydrolase-like protein with peptidoglycan-binding domain
MRFFHAVAFLSALCALGGVAAATPPAKTTKKAVAKKKSTAPAAKSKSVKSVKGVKGKTTKAPAATWRTRQQAPTPDRYKEIQQALVDKGYLKGEPTGVWDASSIEAMQRFQTDQKMTPTGKINAPSLIGLGLGAKSAGAPEAAPLSPATPAPPQ